METHLPEALRATPEGREMERVLRACVHCGFCNAACPTYQLLGDETDGPRGRIYLMKAALEAGRAGPATRRHLDRCLGCLACEATCPSGVRYGRLLELARPRIETLAPTPAPQRLLRWLVRRAFARRGRAAAALAAGRLLRPLLPPALRRTLPPRPGPVPPWPGPRHRRRVLLPAGCVQSAAAPAIDTATARLLDGLGLSAVRPEGDGGCCGALSHHLGATGEARALARRNVRAWLPYVEAGAPLVLTASGCAAHVRAYGELLADDPALADGARQVAAAVRDPVELLEPHAARLRPAAGAPRRIACHEPCTQRHALGLAGRLEALLARVGFETVPVPEPHLCCGSAGAWSLLHPRLAGRLRARKLERLTAGTPEAIATANIGCLLHLAAAAPVPVRHWLELVSAG